MWKTLLCVGAGSFVGGIARYGLTRWVSAGNFTHLPLGTMVVNVAGCLFIGLLYGWFERADVLSPEWRLFLTVGFCGGFTTFFHVRTRELHPFPFRQVLVVCRIRGIELCFGVVGRVVRPFSSTCLLICVPKTQDCQS